MKTQATQKPDLKSIFFIFFMLFFGLAWLVTRMALGKSALTKDLYTFKYTYK